LYVVLPYLALTIVGYYLPIDLDHGRGQIQAVYPSPPGAVVDLGVYIQPSRARRLAERIGHVWIPPWLLRPGMSGSGSLVLAQEGAADVTLSWCLVISGREPRPTVQITITPAQAARLLASYAEVSFGGVGLSWSIQQAHLETVSTSSVPTPACELALQATGSVRMRFGAAVSEVPITRLRCHLTIRYEHRGLGWHPQLELAIDDLETPAVQGALLTSPSSRAQIALLINSHLTRRLADTILPEWFPTDAVALGDVEAPAAQH
jgi:hypothetical protein